MTSLATAPYGFPVVTPSPFSPPVSGDLMPLPTVKAILARIAADSALTHIARAVADNMGTTDDAHSMGHLLRVACWTLRVTDAPLDPRLAISAALLHDVVNLPKNHPDRARASEMSAGFAAELLPTLGFSTAEVTSVADAVRDHSYSRGVTPASALGQALQDADRLEALGALGIFRTLVTGARINRPFVWEADPWAEHRAVDDTTNSLDHFFQKILKLPTSMRTRIGRIEAARRSRIIVQFLECLGEELGQPVPEALLAPTRDVINTLLPVENMMDEAGLTLTPRVGPPPAGHPDCGPPHVIVARVRETRYLDADGDLYALHRLQDGEDGGARLSQWYDATEFALPDTTP
jgi:uncharacterized protein